MPSPGGLVTGIWQTGSKTTSVPTYQQKAQATSQAQQALDAAMRAHANRQPLQVPRFLDPPLIPSMDANAEGGHIQLAEDKHLWGYKSVFFVNRDHPVQHILAPQEVYWHRRLKYDAHALHVSLGDGTIPCSGVYGSVITQEMEGVIKSYDNKVIVLRRPHHLYQKHVEGQNIPLGKIAKFVFEKGDCDPNREESLHIDSKYGQRVELGANPLNPDLVCGKGLFDETEDAEVIAGIGIAVDCLTSIIDDVHINHWRVKPQFPDPVPIRKYVQPLRDFLGARRLRGHWVSIHLKKITWLQTVKEHFDTKNSGDSEYDGTSGLAFHFLDENGDLWRIVFLINSREAITNQYTKVRSDLKTNCSLYENKVNRDLRDKGIDCTFRNMHDFYLHDRLDWRDEIPIAGADGQSFNFPRHVAVLTTMLREFWLSAMVHCIVEICENFHLSDFQKVQLALAASYQNTCTLFWIIFHHVSPEEWKKSSSPFLLYSRKSMEMFGKFCGGKDPRYSSPMNVAKHFLGMEDGESKLARFTQLLIEFLQDTDANPDKCESMDVWSKRNNMFLHHVKNEIPELRDVNIQMDEFRLQIFLQICLLCKIVVCGGKKYKDLGYPAESRASRRHLVDVGMTDNTLIQMTMNDLREDLNLPEDCGNNWLECILCEAFPFRGHNVYDIFPYGVSLFLLNAEGKVVRKPFGMKDWEEWVPKGDDATLTAGADSVVVAVQ